MKHAPEIFLLTLVLLASVRAESTPDVAALLQKVKPGDQVHLPAGTYRTSITLPPGVSLSGDGYDKTIIDAGSAAAGIQVSGSNASTIENLSIRTLGAVGIDVQASSQIHVRNVRITGGVIGARLQKVAGGQVENLIDNGSMTGLSINRTADTAVTQCTLVDNSAIGLSVTDTHHVAVFNNVVSGAGTGIVVGGSREALTVDSNEYVVFHVGKAEGEMARLSVGPWRDSSGGLDAHSVQLPVVFADPKREDFRPVSRLDWAPQRSTVAGWGVRSLSGFAAPDKDIDGVDRAGRYDLGAYAIPDLSGLAMDGSFTVAGDEGIKSAGLFTPDGVLLHYLFHDLPLKKGEYGYVLPSRTQLGGLIPAGSFQLRLVESDLRWEDRGITANNGLSGSDKTTDDQHTQFVAFGKDGSLLMAHGWSERAENVRCLDYRTRKPKWSFPGQSMSFGLCVGAEGTVYCLRDGGGQNRYVLSKLDPVSGSPLNWADGKPVATVTIPEGAPDGIAELDGILYVADPAANKIWQAHSAQPDFANPIATPGPSSPSADVKRKLLWVVSERSKVLALEPGGAVRATFTGVERPLGVAVHGDLLAVASATTGRVHLFDCSDPANLKPIRGIGRGDGPFGPILPDRFYFQAHPDNRDAGSVVLSLDDAGDLAVRDMYNRTIVFDAQGQARYHSFAQFGNYPHQAFFSEDKVTRFFDSNGDVSWTIDAAAGTWKPDAHWGYPAGKKRSAYGFFSDSGKQFGVLDYEISPGHSGVLIVRFEDYIAKPLAFYTQEQIVFPPGGSEKRGMWVIKRDTNQDGRIDDFDGPGTPVLDAEGKPVTWQLVTRFLSVLPEGSIVSPSGVSNPPGLGYVWKRHGLDADGAPAYQFGPDSLIKVDSRTAPSAYDFDQTEDLGNQSETTFAPNGDYLATFQFGHAPVGMGLSNSGAVDLARFEPSGRMRWLLPLNDFGPLQGVKAAEKFTLTSWGHQAEWIGLSDDGLSLGHLGFPPTVGWNGYWVDHPTHYRLFRGNDGRLHALVGDYMQNAQHWLSFKHEDSYRPESFPVTISPAKARELEFEPARPYPLRAKPPQPRIVVRKLNGPLTIDGSLEKWRAASVAPQIVMTPVTGHGIESPRDASAVIRVAYQGQDLYVQILRFDDVVSFHQPSNKSHLQDTMEMSLNGFFEGFQFSISHFTDTGDDIIRRRFFFGKLDDHTPAAHAPRVVRVLDNARQVEERKLIEAIYGQDMSDCKVIVTEFKLPIDKITYRGAEEAIFPVKSGAGFWIGFAIDDNDTPGSDIQKMIVWPATYGTFNVKEEGAWAVFE